MGLLLGRRDDSHKDHTAKTVVRVRRIFELVYDVTSLGGTPQALIETIRTTVQSEEWLDTGSGIGAISAIRVGQRNLLIVSQSYNVHRQVRRLLSDLHSAGGTETGGLPRTYRKRGLAKPVVLPETQASDRDVIRVTGLPKKQPPRHENKLGESGGVF